MKNLILILTILFEFQVNAQYGFGDSEIIKNKVTELNSFYNSNTGPFLESLDSISQYNEYWNGDSSLNKIERFEYSSSGFCTKSEIEFLEEHYTFGYISFYHYDEQNRIDSIFRNETENSELLEMVYSTYRFGYDLFGNIVDFEFGNYIEGEENYSKYREEIYYNQENKIDSIKSFFFDSSFPQEIPYRSLIYNYDSLGRIISKVESATFGELKRLLYSYEGDSLTEIIFQSYAGQWKNIRKTVYYTPEIIGIMINFERFYSWSSEYNHWFRTMSKIRTYDFNTKLLFRTDTVYMDPANITYSSSLQLTYEYDSKGNLENVNQITIMANQDTFFYSYPSIIDASISYSSIMHVPFFPPSGEVNTEDKLLSYHSYSFGSSLDTIQSKTSIFCYYSPTLRIEENESSFELKVYPNPLTETFYLELPRGINFGTLEVYNLEGKKFKSFSLTYSKNQIILFGIPSGVYLGIFKNNEVAIKFKLVKLY
jgi:hypothetical protein